MIDKREFQKEYGFAYAVDWLSSDNYKHDVIETLLLPHAKEALGRGKMIEIRGKLGPLAVPDFGRNPKFKLNDGMEMKTWQWGMAWFHRADMSGMTAFPFRSMATAHIISNGGYLLLARIKL